LKRLKNRHVKAFPYSLNPPEHTTPHTLANHLASVNNPLHPLPRGSTGNADSFPSTHFANSPAFAQHTRAHITRHLAIAAILRPRKIGKPPAHGPQSRELEGFRPKRSCTNRHEARAMAVGQVRALEQAAVLATFLR